MSNVPSNLIPVRITSLQIAPVASPDGLLLYVYDGVSYKIRAGDLLSVAGVPTSRQVIAGTALTGGGALSSNVTISVANGGIGTSQLASSGVTPGVYGNSTNVPVLTVDATGRVMAATTAPITISGYVPTSRQIIAGTGLSGGGNLSSDVTLTANFSSSAPLSGASSGSAGSGVTMSRADHQHPSVDLADSAEVNGILGLSNGGTARSLVMQPGAVIWSGADGLYVGAAGVSGQVLLSGGASAPTWGTALVVSPQPANYFFAGPASGANADPTFRAMVTNDLPASGVTANTYGSSTTVPVFAVNAKGQITGVTNTAITGFGSVTSVAVSGGTTGLTTSGGPITGSGTITLSGTLIAANGGTGFATYAVGDLLYASSTTALSKLADVATGNALISGGVGVAPSWGKIGLTTHVSGTLAAGNGGTGFATYAVGDILYASTTTALSKLADVATGNSLISGGVGVAPSWGKIGLTTHISGTLSAGNGGTGLATYAVGDILYASTTSALSALADVATGNSLISGGVGVAPSWGKIGLTTHVSGTLPIANGGTNGTATPTAGAISYGNGTAFAFTAAGTSGQVLTSAGAGIPTWTTPTTGTVTSVAQTFTGGLVSVAGSPVTGSGTLALTVAGTSGGIPYFSSASTWASSAALTANALVIGGGAGVAPATTTTGTGVVTALGTNVGTAGAFVVNGGALGTPSSGTATNLTGTASSLTAGIATNTTITNDAATAVPVYPTWVTANTGNLPQKTTSTRLSFVPSTGVLTSAAYYGSDTATPSVFNSSVGVGTNTPLTSILSGTAITAEVQNTDPLGIGTANAMFRAHDTLNGPDCCMIGAGGFVNAGVMGTFTTFPLAFYVDSTEAMRITTTGSVGIGKTNPTQLLDVDGTVAALNFSGPGTSLTGTASGLSIGGTAANATNTGITNDSTTAVAVYPTWVTANTGNLPQKTTSTRLSFVPSTGVLSVTGLSLTNALGIGSGGTGQTTANAALNALLPAQATNSGKFLTTNGTDTSWATVSGSGTVTSVAQSFTGGLISVAGSPITAAGTLALTVAGTSGGIPYFSSAAGWASSAALAASALVVGGGAGAAPSTVTTGTGVVTALGVNTGSAGAFVVNGGALGTPSSGTVTNLTGTASISINGTVGATTANTGAFTTVVANTSAGIGAIAPTATNFYNAKNITGATTATANSTLATIQSDVTAQARGYTTNLGTVASAFTLASLRHFYAFQGTIGAGSTVSAQAGFLSENTLVGATNNYGFFAGDTAAVNSPNTAYGFYSAVNIPTGTGTTWGVYAAGTANNLFRSNTYFGNTATPTAKIHVAAGTATANTAPIKLTAGTNLSAVEVGAFEYDGKSLFFSAEANQRGVVNASQYVILTSDYTTPTGTANVLKQAFNATTNGALTLDLGSYLFECLLNLSALSATSGTIAFGFGGTAAGRFRYLANAKKAAAAASAPSITFSNTAAATTITPASTTTTGYALIQGSIVITTAGTIIPSIALSVAAANVVATGSYFRLTPIGSSTATTVGNWS